MSEKEEPGYIEKAKNMAKAVSKHVAGGDRKSVV